MANDIFVQCTQCGESVSDSGKFCPDCGCNLDENISKANFIEQTQYYLSEAAGEFFETGKDIVNNETSRKIAGGAAIGALVAMPIAGWAAGAAIGAAIMVYRQTEKNK